MLNPLLEWLKILTHFSGSDRPNKFELSIFFPEKLTHCGYLGSYIYDIKVEGLESGVLSCLTEYLILLLPINSNYA